MCFNFESRFPFMHLISLILILYAFSVSFLFILSLLRVIRCLGINQRKLYVCVFSSCSPYDVEYNINKDKNFRTPLNSNYIFANPFHCFRSTVEQLMKCKSAVITLRKVSPLTNSFQLTSADVN